MVVATVEDSGPGTPHDRRPRSVTLATWCLGVALLIGTAILGFAWGFPPQAFLTLLIIGFLVFNLARRRNWARWTLAIITATSFVFMWSLIRFQLTYSPLIGTATVVQICLELIGFTLLFTPPSNRWYRRMI